MSNSINDSIDLLLNRISAFGDLLECLDIEKKLDLKTVVYTGEQIKELSETLRNLIKGTRS